MFSLELFVTVCIGKLFLVERPKVEYRENSIHTVENNFESDQAFQFSFIDTEYAKLISLLYPRLF